MAKPISYFDDTVLAQRDERALATISLAGIGRRIASLLAWDREKNVERFIRQRSGGVMSDGIERELSRHFGRM